VEAVGYRWADYDTPLWASPNRLPGRFHLLGSDATQYWSLHPLGPWAEYVRAHGIRDTPGLLAISSRVWAGTFALPDSAVAEVTFDTAGEWEMVPEALVDDDRTACQELGDAVRSSYDALVVPSAALPGTRNLVVFGARLAAPYGAPPVDPDLDVPVAVTAEGSHPPASLLTLVRHRGDAHPGLQAWQAGGDLAPPSPRYSQGR
jgi:hypothetical protein